MTTNRLATAANRHYVAAYRKLVEHSRGEVREFGPITAFVTDVPIAFANGCIAMANGSVADLHAALAWLRASGQPFQVHVDAVRAPGMLEIVEGNGLMPERPAPVMALAPPSELPPAPDNVTVMSVDAQSYADFLLAMSRTWMPRRLARRLTPLSYTIDPQVRCFVARLDGDVAGTASVIRTGATSGIYAVATAERARRRGVGTALTWAAVSAARDWGSEAVFLQSSAMGYSVYRAMGFAAVGEYRTFSSGGVRQASSRPPRAT